MAAVGVQELLFVVVQDAINTLVDCLGDAADLSHKGVHLRDAVLYERHLTVCSFDISWMEVYTPAADGFLYTPIIVYK